MIPMSTLRDRVLIEARMLTPDGAGGQAESWTVVPWTAARAAWACRIASRGSSLRRTNDQTESVYTHDLYFQAGAPVTFAGHRLRVGDVVPQAGDVIYEVLGVFDEIAYRRVQVRVVQ